MEGTADPLHTPDPTLEALGHWCDIALHASNSTAANRIQFSSRSRCERSARSSGGSRL